MKEAALVRALRLAGAEPSKADWRQFIDRLMLGIGTMFMSVGVIFFFAFNWQALGRFAKFGLIEGLIVVTVATCWWLGLERLSGKAALFAATVLIGGLLALVGQTYQTGADPWQLFAVWAIMVLPWVVIGRFGVLLLFWVGLLNLSIVLYFQAFPRFFGLVDLLFGAEALLWSLFLVNILAQFLWEFAAWRKVGWLAERWPLRVLAVAGGSLITTLAIWSIIESRSFSLYGLLGYCLWLAATYFTYRRKLVDIFILAGGVLSVIVVGTTALARGLFDHGGNAASLLFVGLVVIGLSAAGGFWLNSIAREESR